MNTIRICLLACALASAPVAYGNTTPVASLSPRCHNAIESLIEKVRKLVEVSQHLCERYEKLGPILTQTQQMMDITPDQGPSINDKKLAAWKTIHKDMVVFLKELEALKEASETDVVAFFQKLEMDGEHLFELYNQFQAGCFYFQVECQSTQADNKE